MAVITAFVGSCPNLSEKTHSDKLLNIPSEQVNEWKYFTLTIILPAQRAFCWSNWARCRHPTVLVFFFLNAKAQTAFSPTSNQGTAIETTCTDVVSLSKAINFCPVTLHIIFCRKPKGGIFPASCLHECFGPMLPGEHHMKVYFSSSCLSLYDHSVPMLEWLP